MSELGSTSHYQSVGDLHWFTGRAKLDCTCDALTHRLINTYLRNVLNMIAGRALANDAVMQKVVQLLEFAVGIIDCQFLNPRFTVSA